MLSLLPLIFLWACTPPAPLTIIGADTNMCPELTIYSDSDTFYAYSVWWSPDDKSPEQNPNDWSPILYRGSEKFPDFIPMTEFDQPFVDWACAHGYSRIFYHIDLIGCYPHTLDPDQSCEAITNGVCTAGDGPGYCDANSDYSLNPNLFFIGHATGSFLGLAGAFQIENHDFGFAPGAADMFLEDSQVVPIRPRPEEECSVKPFKKCSD